MSTIFVDSRINAEELYNLKQLSTSIMKVPCYNKLYTSIQGHPDILMHIVNKNTIIVHKDMPIDFIHMLHKLNFNVLLSDSALESSYPLDIRLNAVSLPNYFIHTLKYSDKKLLNYNKKKTLINVKQGYTKCSLAIVNNSSFITSDISMAKTLNDYKFNVLYVPAGDIVLDGLDYGFIGGTCGLIEENILCFFGDLNYYKYGNEVLDFLRICKVEPIFLRKGKLIDRGSILCNF